jgi:translation initiation factor 1 (eIF-1/SUI1)
LKKETGKGSIKKMKKLEINGISFDLPERYEPIKLIGKGTYGAVVSAIDNLNKEKVAIKKLAKIEDMVHPCVLRFA